MLSSPVFDLAPELQTSEIPEGFMKHPVYAGDYKPVVWSGISIPLHTTAR
jgi:hypothetical protein